MATESQELKTGIELVGEYLVPGGANLIAGQYKEAGMHAVTGVLAKMVLGVPGLILVSANSISKAVTGQHLWEHLGKAVSSKGDQSSNPQPESSSLH